jgi:uroporphyrinogen-III synthase
MKKILYLGTDPSHFSYEGEIVHYPVIRLVPKKFPHIYAKQATHLLFTSKNSVHFFLNELCPLPHQKIIAIGKITARTLSEKQFSPSIIPEKETQEGLIARLEMEDMRDWNVFYPRSSKARPNLFNYFLKKGIFCTAWDLYDPIFQKLEPVPSLEDFDAVVFTSPSTVEGFFRIFSRLTIAAIASGPITAEALRKYFKTFSL